MTAEGIPFEIATTGNSGSLVRNESKLSAVRSEYKDGIVSGTYRVSNNGDSLKLRYDPNVDDPLTEDIFSILDHMFMINVLSPVLRLRRIKNTSLELTGVTLI